MTGIELIATERYEQVIKHDKKIEDDVTFNDKRELAIAASELIRNGYFVIPSELPIKKWGEDVCMKLADKSYKERLIIAGALIAAEIDRLQYMEINSKLSSSGYFSL